MYHILQLRSEVFVVEQTCVYQDLDGKDTHPHVKHVFVKDDASAQNPMVAYARLLPQGVSYADVSMGRIVLAPEFRGEGLGRQFIAHCIKHTLQCWTSHAITIGAQSHLSDLYQEFGFVEVSEHYLEDGILHVDMQAVSPTYKEYL